MLSALQTGNTLKVILDLNPCTTADGKPGPATGRVDYQGLQGDCPERHQLLQCSSNRGQFRVPGDGIHPPHLSREGKLTVRASKLVAGPAKVMNEGEFVC